MKFKKIIGAVAAVVTSAAVAAGLAACGGGSGNTAAPDTAHEYAQWLINKLKPSYGVTAHMSYVDRYNPDVNDPNYEELKDLHTDFSAYVTKSGSTTVSTVMYETSDLGKSGSDKVIEVVKEEFTKSGDGYAIKEFNDYSKIAVSKSVDEQAYLDETRKALLPETLLSLCADTESKYELQLRKGIAPKKYGYTENEDFTLLAFAGFMTSGEYDSTVSMEIVVYKNELQNIDYYESGRDATGEEYYHEATVVIPSNQQNATEPFEKTGYYSSVTERATEMLNGVLNNLPTTFQVVQTEKTVLSDYVSPANYSYFAYEKSGDTVYYYSKSSKNGTWKIEETYTKNGEGHIGRVYNTSTNTYSEHVCDKEVCLYTNNDPDPQKFEQHVFINATDTSFALWEKFLEMMDEATIEFGEDGECILVFEPVEGDTSKITLTIKDNEMKKMVLETSTDEFPAIPNVTAGGTAETTVTVTYTYGTAAINADLSGYSKAE